MSANGKDLSRIWHGFDDASRRAISLLAVSPVISLPVCKVSSKFLQHNRCKVICLQEAG